MRGLLIAITALACQGASAQSLTGGSVDASAFQTRAEAASTFATQSAVAAVQAAIPTPATTAPPMETPVGTPGSASTYRRGDAVQPRITRSRTVTLDAVGTATFDWTAQGSINTPVQVVVTPVYTGAGTPICWATAASGTSVSVKCSLGTSQGLTLSALTGAGLAGLTINPFGGSVSGMSVGIVVLPSS